MQQIKSWPRIIPKPVIGLRDAVLLFAQLLLADDPEGRDTNCRAYSSNALYKRRRPHGVEAQPSFKSALFATPILRTAVLLLHASETYKFTWSPYEITMLSNIIALMLFSNPNWFAESVGAVAIDLEARTPLHSGDIPTTNKQPIAINCKGSGRCPAHPNYPVLESLLPFIDNVDDDYLFINGEHIVCNADPYVSVCAFFQRLPNVTESYFGAVSGADVKKLIPQLLDFGCKACGRYVPLPETRQRYRTSEFDIYGTCADLSPVSRSTTSILRTAS